MLVVAHVHPLLPPLHQVLQREGFTGLEEVVKLLPGGVHDNVKLRTPGKGIHLYERVC